MKKQTIILREERHRSTLIELLSGLNLEKTWEVVISPYRKRRSLSQNALYWKWLSMAADKLSEHSGYDKDDIHEFFKMKFLTPKLIDLNGEVRKVYSTKKLSTAEFIVGVPQTWALCCPYQKKSIYIKKTACKHLRIM